MRHTKKGFTLIETMFALLVATLIITPLMRLLLRTIDVVGKQEARLLDQIALQRFLYESRLYADHAENFERQEVLDMQKTIFFTRTPSAEKSEFAQPFLFAERVFIQDKTSRREFTQELITFHTVLPPAKEPQPKKGAKEANTAKETKQGG